METSVICLTDYCSMGWVCKAINRMKSAYADRRNRGAPLADFEYFSGS